MAAILETESPVEILRKYTTGKELFDFYIRSIKRGENIIELSRAFVSYAPGVILDLSVDDPYRGRLTTLVHTLLSGGLEALTELRSRFDAGEFKSLRNQYWTRTGPDNIMSRREVLRTVRSTLPSVLTDNTHMKWALDRAIGGYVLNPWEHN